jgi:hypothetical protein
MKGEKGGQQLGEGNTIDELSDESFGTQSLNTTILSDEAQHNVIYTTAAFAPSQVFKLNN